MGETGTAASGWGLRPIAFSVGPVAVPAYELFVVLGIVAGLLTLNRLAPRDRGSEHATTWIVAAALIGGALGAKLLELALLPWATVRSASWAATLLSGKTVIGGFLGGSAAVLAVKRRLGIRDRRGNEIAPAVAIGLALGRIGCLCAGCCHGRPTRLPWGIDLGDGTPRHPTQLLEAGFALAAFSALLAWRRRGPRPGSLFTGFAVAYLVFRFFEEFLRDGARVALGLTAYQLAAAAALAWFAVVARMRPRPAWKPVTPRE